MDIYKFYFARHCFFLFYTNYSIIIPYLCNQQNKQQTIMKKSVKIALAITALLLIAASITGYNFYKKIYSPNVYVKNTKLLYIPHNATYNQVKDSIYKNFRIEDKEMLEMVATMKGYPDKIKSGRYEVTDGMSNNAFIDMLRSGNQKPVNVTFNNIRTLKQLCSRISRQLDIDSTYLYGLLTDDNAMKPYGFNGKTSQAMFIPDTYQFYWNTSAEKFVEKMFSYYKKFWNDERMGKAQKMKLTPLEVSILASIVQSEQAAHKDEQPTIAGLYINRLRIGMPLQSCPTLIFAIGDFSIKRVTGKMLEYDSPYNTYKNQGLPPSPIGFPEVNALDAVLNYDHNDYIYMCAKSDFSGYHHFSKTYAEQQHWAAEFQKQLNKKGIH